jgi:hypothetical protein
MSEQSAISQLVAMRASGEISAEEFRLAKKYLKEELAAQAQPKTKTFGGIVGWCVVGLIAVAFISTMGSPRANVGSADARAAASPPALEKMAAVFRGAYSEAEIDALLSRVMNMYGTALTEQEYLRWGNVLVALRQNNHPVTEMEILSCMRSMGPTLPFHEAAAICATGLAIGL